MSGEERRHGTKALALQVLETLLLFAALFLTLPSIASNDVAELPLTPVAVIATLLFAASRMLRWRPRYLWPLVEAAAFLAFAWVVNAIANLLYSL